MEGSHSQGGGGGSSSPAPFLIKTYEMVEDPATNHVVSWGPGGASFVVWNPPDFSRDLLPKYFKHNNFSSFIRQLNTYGFRKIDPERWEFANEDFIRGHTHLLKNIHRRKPVHSHSLQNQVNGPLAEAERRELEDEINRLKYEKSLLLADLQRQNQQQCGINWQMQSLEDRLMQMEQRQKNIVASLCDILQRHGVVSSSLPATEADHFSKKRRVPKIDFFVDDATAEEQRMPYLQAVGAEAQAPGMFPVHPVNAEPFERMELALVSLENFFQRASDASAEDLHSSGGAAASPALTLGDMPSAPMENNIILPSSGGHVHSPSDFAESPSYARSPTLPLAEIHDHQDTHKTADVDMNSETSTADTSQEETTTETSQEPGTVNDLFWERFLTDTTQSSNAGEVESGRQNAKREAAEVTDDLKIGVDCSCLHHQDKVNQISEKMGRLASAESA
ncbi:hypothetical protein ACP70R_040509 [Stipagrostis hirtigluma subsp. patula]